jgi:hypothetical protein
MRGTLVAIAAVAMCAPAFAADAPPKPAPATAPSCTSPEHHQMDFWVGDWNAAWQGGHGTNHVTKEMNGCVIHEHFAAAASAGRPALHGESLSSYQPANLMWRQTWVDDQNGYFHLSGGREQDGTFVLQTIRMGREPHMTRMIFQDIKPDSFTWRWQMSDDGETWKDAWVIHYTRLK